jgi:tellurite methyltransferase
MTDGGYDAGYRSCDCFWGTTPGSLVERLKKLLPSCGGLRVLDAGCGEGKNALFMASQGAAVDGFDISEIAIEHARNLINDKETDIRFTVSDIRHVDLRDRLFDVVISYGLFHCLSGEDEIVQVCTKLQKATCPGGYFILCAFNSRFQDLSAHPGFSPTTLSHHQYEQFFDRWELIESTDTDLVETHPHNGILHTHSMTRIIAKKSG